MKGACREIKQCSRGAESNFYLNEVREEHSGKREGRKHKSQRAQCLTGIRNSTCLMSDHDSRRNGRKWGQICGVSVSVLRALISLAFIKNISRNNVKSL